MASIKPTYDKNEGNDGVELITWTPLTQTGSDVGVPFMYPDIAFEKVIQVDGTFGVGGTLVFEGSIDGTNWTTMKDNTGATMSVTTTFVRNVFDSPLYFRPRISGGDGTTSLRCILMLRKQILRPF